MRLVIDLQGAQGNSRLRGIGRLSRELALAMARDAGRHEVLVALSGAFPEAADELGSAFAAIIGRDAVRVWQPTGRSSPVLPEAKLRRFASEHIRAQFLRSLAPDLVHVASLFEGHGDDVISYQPTNGSALSSVATLYDLIPLIRREQYLDGEWSKIWVRPWYMQAIEQARQMPGLLAISESSRQEAIDHLGTPPDRVFNIRAGVSSSFLPAPLQGLARLTFLQRYGLPNNYVLYLGGGDHRKNEAGLIEAYGLLPAAIRAKHKLAIVGRVDETVLRAKAANAGIAADLILIPFVDEADLPAIYSLCSVFVFPSFHEGFGLPAAEAMACGAAVIGSDTTSLPEVIGRADALFDPHKPAAIAGLMHRVLSDDVFRTSLIEHGPVQAGQFTWAESARRAWSALEAIEERKGQAALPQRMGSGRRLSLAVTSPLPPQQSGTADDTYQLLPELAKYYDITLVNPEPLKTAPALQLNFKVLSSAVFDQCAETFDRVLHQLGSSMCHLFQIDELMPRHPGVVVLHDVFMSNVLEAMAQLEGAPERFRETVLQTHGIRSFTTSPGFHSVDALEQFPCALAQIRQSMGVIVHSQHARTLIGEFYGQALSTMTKVISTSRRLSDPGRRSHARTRLDLTASTVVIATFGGLTSTRVAEQVLKGFSSSFAGRNSAAILVFVGDIEKGLAMRLREQAAAPGIAARLVFTHCATPETYQDWLAATDIAVQLGTGIRSGTSVAAADCLAAGIPTIVNAHGALAELPAETVVLLADQFDTVALAAAIDRLAGDVAMRRDLGKAARDYAATQLSTTRIAGEYHSAIEAFYAANSTVMNARNVLQALAGYCPGETADPDTIPAIGRAMAWSFPMPRPRRLMLDITCWSEAATGARQNWEGVAVTLLAGTAADERGELMKWVNGSPVIAWSEASRQLGIPEFADAPSGRPLPGDLLLCPALPGQTHPASVALANWAHRGGATVVWLGQSRNDLSAALKRNDIDAMVVLDEPREEGGNAAFSDRLGVLFSGQRQRV